MISIVKFMVSICALLRKRKNGEIVRDREEVILKLCRYKDVLDVGCVGDFGRLHKLIAKVAQSVLGIDINRNDVEILQKQCYSVIYGDAENFVINKQFDIIVGGVY